MRRGGYGLPEWVGGWVVGTSNNLFEVRERPRQPSRVREFLAWASRLAEKKSESGWDCDAGIYLPRY